MVQHHVIITDSRGRHLQPALNRHTQSSNIHFTSYFHPGDGIYRITNKACTYAQSYPTHIVYIMAGVNDITVRCGRPHRFRYPYNSSEDQTAYITSLLDNANTFLHDTCPSSKFIFCPIIGLSLSKYLGDNSTTNQSNLDNSIMDINRYILQLNQANGTHTPWTATIVHKSRHSKITHYYEKLGDGLHPSAEVLDFWAHALLRVAPFNA